MTAFDHHQRRDVFEHVAPEFVAAALCSALLDHPDTPADEEPALLFRLGFPPRMINAHIDVARRARDELRSHHG